MTEIFTGLNRFWRRFGESKKLNFAKAIAEYLAEKLSIPISNSRQLMALRKFMERHLGSQLAEAGEDGLTILAKTLIHAPDRLIEFLSAITGRPKSEVTVVVNQFLDELVKGIITNHHSFETQAEAKNAIVQTVAVANDDFKATDTALTEVLSVKYAYDTHRKDVHFIGCDEVNEFVNVKEEGGSDGKDGDKSKKGSRRVRKLKSHIRELTLGDLLEFGIDPLGFRPGCCGGVTASDLQKATGTKAVEATKPLSFRLCLASMGQEGQEIGQRVQAVIVEWSEDLLAATADPMQVAVLHVSREQVEEVRDDYFMRSIWTPDLVRLFMTAWSPLETQTRIVKLLSALECLHGIAPAKPKPKPETPGRLDRFLSGAVEFGDAYIRGDDNAPIIGAVRTRVSRITTSLEQGNAANEIALKEARRIRRAGK